MKKTRKLTKIWKITHIFIAVAVLLMPTAAFAVEGAQAESQYFTLEARDWLGEGERSETQHFEAEAHTLTVAWTQTAPQRFIVLLNEEGMAYQRFEVHAFDPVMALGVVGPEALALTPNVAAHTEMTVQAYAGMAEGYALNYQYHEADLVCVGNDAYAIASIGVEGDLAGNVWGQNLVSDEDLDGHLDVPESWLPINTSLDFLAGTSGPSALPFDEYYLMLGVHSNSFLPACEYQDTVTFTMTPRF